MADWFRSRLQSCLPVLISCAAAFAAALCQVGLLLAEGGTPWFALGHSLEAAAAVPLLLLAYRRSAGRQPLRPHWSMVRSLWNRGRHFLLSGLLVALYGQMDRVMLRAMLGDTAVGLYGAASAISTLWIFIPAALVETARPLLLARYHRDPLAFPQKLAALYSVLWYGSACWPTRFWESSMAAHSYRLAAPYGCPPGGRPLPAWALPGAFICPPTINSSLKSTWQPWVLV